MWSQLDVTRGILDSIKTSDPPPKQEIGLRTVADLHPVVTEQQKADALEKFSVSRLLTEFVCALLKKFELIKFFVRNCMSWKKSVTPKEVCSKAGTWEVCYDKNFHIWNCDCHLLTSLY